MTQTIRLTGFDQLQRVYDDIGQQFHAIDWKSELDAELDFLADQEKGMFDNESGPDGTPWAANAPSTIQQKGHSLVLRGKKAQAKPFKIPKGAIRKGRPRFSTASGIGGFRLASSLTQKSTESFGDGIREAVATDGGGILSFGTTLPYAIYNQFGTSRIPARPMIGFTDRYLDEATNRIADAAVKHLK